MDLVECSHSGVARWTRWSAPTQEWPDGLGGVLPLRRGNVNWVKVRKWVLSGLLRGLAAVVGTVLEGKLAQLLLAEGREAIGSRLRINFIHLPAVLNRTSFKLGQIERTPPEARQMVCYLDGRKGGLKSSLPSWPSRQTLKGWSHQEHGTLTRKAVLPPMQWAGRPLGSALWWKRWEVQQGVST